MNELELLTELSKGNALAFNDLVVAYKDRLIQFAEYYLNDTEQSKDIVQDVFSNLWEEHHKLTEVKNLSSWLYTMTKYQCLKKIDRIKVKRKYEDNLKYRQLELTQSALKQLDTSPLVFDEIKTILDQTLSKLPIQTRKIFVMSRFDNKKNKEIAEQLGISVKTVEAAITKSIKQLRPALKSYLSVILF
ncbi:MAG: RNA polymerase sigma-70 factor [Carboxylicivirga sp.]|nr:RNA polymerase sigma-70 factor [Carboxylicivirga sp.]